jgi:hypothetical protein
MGINKWMANINKIKAKRPLYPVIPKLGARKMSNKGIAHPSTIHNQ